MAEAPWRSGLTFIKRRAPATYWRVRNGVALAGWVWHRARRRGGAAEPFDDAFWSRHDVGDWDGVARLVLAFFEPSAVLDVGCGQGSLLASLATRRPGMRLVGIEDSAAALARARARGVNVAALDIAGASSPDIEAAATRLGSFDLAICLEVAEHLPGWHSGKLLRLLTRAPRVLFSAAHPNQGGVLHVNEQPPEYWIGRMRALGYGLSARDAEFRARLAEIDLPPWYAENAHIFEKAVLPD